MATLDTQTESRQVRMVMLKRSIPISLAHNHGNNGSQARGSTTAGCTCTTQTHFCAESPHLTGPTSNLHIPIGDRGSSVSYGAALIAP